MKLFQNTCAVFQTQNISTPVARLPSVLRQADLEHDQTDFLKKSEMPVLVLWGDAGFVGQNYNVICEWKAVATTSSARPRSGRSFFTEEAPNETQQKHLSIFSQR